MLFIHLKRITHTISIFFSFSFFCRTDLFYYLSLFCLFNHLHFAGELTNPHLFLVPALRVRSVCLRFGSPARANKWKYLFYHFVMIIFVRSFSRHDTPRIDYSYFIYLLTLYWLFVRHICIDAFGWTATAKYTILTLSLSLSFFGFRPPKVYFGWMNSYAIQTTTKTRRSSDAIKTDDSVVVRVSIKFMAAKKFLHFIHTKRSQIIDERWMHISQKLDHARRQADLWQLHWKHFPYDNCRHCVGEWQTKCKYYPNHHMIFVGHVQNQGLLHFAFNENRFALNEGIRSGQQKKKKRRDAMCRLMWMRNIEAIKVAVHRHNRMSRLCIHNHIGRYELARVSSCQREE